MYLDNLFKFSQVTVTTGAIEAFFLLNNILVLFLFLIRFQRKQYVLLSCLIVISHYAQRSHFPELQPLLCLQICFIIHVTHISFIHDTLSIVSSICHPRQHINISHSFDALRSVEFTHKQSLPM